MGPELNNIVRELQKSLATLYGERLVKIMLYGSQARGDAEPGADIDVLVVLEGETNSAEEIERSSSILSPLSLNYNVVISCVFMDAHRFTSRNGPLLRNIRKEGIPVYDRRPAGTP